jgi:hypothetical protein
MLTLTMRLGRKKCKSNPIECSTIRSNAKHVLCREVPSGVVKVKESYQGRLSYLWYELLSTLGRYLALLPTIVS